MVAVVLVDVVLVLVQELVLVPQEQSLCVQVAEAWELRSN
jgi:hypothetical protein